MKRAVTKKMEVCASTGSDEPGLSAREEARRRENDEREADQARVEDEEDRETERQAASASWVVRIVARTRLLRWLLQCVGPCALAETHMTYKSHT